MELTPAQKRIASDTTRFRVLNCGRRFGKTVLSAWEMFGVAVAKPDRRIPYYAPTRDDARDIMWEELKKIAEPAIVYQNDSRLELRVKTQEGGNSLITLQGWEAVKDRQKGRGVKNDFIVCDEVAKYRQFWMHWNEVLRPTLTDTRGGALFPSTPQGFNHFYDLYNRERTDDDFKSFHFTSYDNPHVPKDEIDKAKIELPEDQFAQEYLADFRKQEGLVYKEFNRDKHLFDNKTILPRFVDTFVGIDFGYRNPAAVLVVRRDFDGDYWITSEWYKSEKQDDEIIEYAASIHANGYYPDPENPGAIKKMQDEGLPVRDVNKMVEYKGKKGVMAGISLVRELFHQGRIHIHVDCVNLISELETYRLKEKTRDNMNEPEEPEKHNDHAVDALRYVLSMVHGTSGTITIEDDFAVYSNEW